MGKLNKTNTFEQFTDKFGDALDKITKNPDGGELILKEESGKEIMRFKMPKLSERNKH